MKGGKRSSKARVCWGFSLKWKTTLLWDYRLQSLMQMTANSSRLFEIKGAANIASNLFSRRTVEPEACGHISDRFSMARGLAVKEACTQGCFPFPCEPSQRWASWRPATESWKGQQTPAPRASFLHQLQVIGALRKLTYCHLKGSDRTPPAEELRRVSHRPTHAGQNRHLSRVNGAFVVASEDNTILAAVNGSRGNKSLFLQNLRQTSMLTVNTNIRGFSLPFLICPWRNFFSPLPVSSV